MDKFRICVDAMEFCSNSRRSYDVHYGLRYTDVSDPFYPGISGRSDALIHSMFSISNPVICIGAW